jgi:hypothetical protein
MGYILANKEMAAKFSLRAYWDTFYYSLPHMQVAYSEMVLSYLSQLPFLLYIEYPWQRSARVWRESQ